VIVVVRHGRTEANAQGLLLGRLDPALDDEGRRQAATIGAGLGALDVARVVTSPLRRCRTTAAAVAEVLSVARDAHVDVEVDDRWVEMDYGVLDGVPLTDVPADTWATWRSDPTWAPEGGESIAQLGTRVRIACDARADEATSRDVVVVTHVSPIKAAVAWALGVGDEVAWRMWVAPASITRIGVGPSGHPALRSFNEVAHLT
jgi:broad specificity phosphatase PhoE